MKFEEIEAFRKDVKGFLKKYKSLRDDLLVVRKVLMVLPDGRPPFSFQVENLPFAARIIKVRKIACKSLKGRGVNSGLRLIYAHFKKENRIVMIGLYCNHDKRSSEKKMMVRKFS